MAWKRRTQIRCSAAERNFCPLLPSWWGKFLFGLRIFTTGVSSLYSSTTSGLLRTRLWQNAEFALGYDLERKWNHHSWQVPLMSHKFFSFFGLWAFREGKVRMNTMKSIWTLPINRRLQIVVDKLIPWIISEALPQVKPATCSVSHHILLGINVLSEKSSQKPPFILRLAS